ncbi:hypothetical protein Bca4012_025450 [Brassica carinata]
MRSEFQFPEKAELCELREKRLSRDMQHDARSTVKQGSHWAAQVMQSGVNPHTAGWKVGKVEGSDHTLKSIHNMKEAFPELWLESINKESERIGFATERVPSPSRENSAVVEENSVATDRPN